jgi:hypothetical protein
VFTSQLVGCRYNSAPDVDITIHHLDIRGRRLGSWVDAYASKKLRRTRCVGWVGWVPGQWMCLFHDNDKRKCGCYMLHHTSYFISHISYLTPPSSSRAPSRPPLRRCHRRWWRWRRPACEPCSLCSLCSSPVYVCYMCYVLCVVCIMYYVLCVLCVLCVVCVVCSSPAPLYPPRSSRSHSLR